MQCQHICTHLKNHCHLRMKQTSDSSSNSSVDSEKKHVSPQLSVSTACIVFVPALYYFVICFACASIMMKRPFKASLFI